MHSLPVIKRKLSSQLGAINADLASLPELPNNVEMEIQTRLLQFEDQARKELDTFVRTFGPLPQSFATCLLEMKPKFMLRDKSDIPDVLEISDDESDATSVAPTPKRRQPSNLSTPVKRQRTDVSMTGAIPINMGTPSRQESGASFASVAGSPTPSQAAAAPPPPPRRPRLSPPFTQFAKVGSSFRTLRAVRDEITSKMKTGMPGVIPAEVYEDLALEAIRPWNQATDVYLVHTMQQVQVRLDETLGSSFGPFKTRFIYAEAKKHLADCLEHHKLELEQSLRLLYNDETERLLTFNEEAFKNYRDSEAITLTRFRHMMRMQAAGLWPQGKQFVPWETLTQEKQAQDVKQRESEVAKLGPDSFAREVEVVAYVRGYYRLAAHRFGDNVTQHILCRMIPSLRRSLARYVEDKLGTRRPDAQSVYERLMEEDETTATKREGLKSDREKLVRALASIEGLEMNIVGDDGSAATNSFSVPLVDESATQDTQMSDIVASGEC